MRLVRLAVAGFRNLEPAEVALDAPVVVLHGPNGHGKTNTLEAIYLLATLKPLRARRNAELVRWGADAASVAGDVSAHRITRRYRVEVDAARRRVELDGRPARDLGEYFEGIRAIAFTPDDTEIVSGSPARRRAWVDRAAFTAHPVHLDVVRTYKRVLDQKAAALKADRPDPAVLDVLDASLAHAGARLVQRRVALLDALAPRVRAMHAAIVGEDVEVAFRYVTEAGGASEAEREAALSERLRRARRDELRRRTTLVGPQGDEVEIVLDGAPARTFASRGQTRSVVLSLKLSEIVLARDTGEVPIFLLDDLSSELDRERTARLLGTLADLGAQVIATTTDPSLLSDSANVRRITVRDGTLVAER